MPFCSIFMLAYFTPISAFFPPLQDVSSSSCIASLLLQSTTQFHSSHASTRTAKKKSGSVLAGGKTVLGKTGTVLAPILMKRSCVVAVEKILSKSKELCNIAEYSSLIPCAFVLVPKSIHLLDNIRSASMFPPLLKNCIETSEPRQQRVRL